MSSPRAFGPGGGSQLFDLPIGGGGQAGEGVAEAPETTREYDKLNRLTRINNAWPGNGVEPPGNAEFNYDVDDLNQRRKITLEDGSYWMYTYDAKGQVTSGKKYFSDGRVMAGQQFEYEYDEIGNRVKTREGHDATGFNARETTWTANKLNQYESRTVPNKVDLRGTVNENATVLVDGHPAATQAIPSPDGGLKYWHGAATLDNTSAPAQKDVKVTAGLPEAGPSSEDLYDQGNKQATLPKHPEEFTYDDDGNLIQDGLRQYTWDAENRLVGVEPIPAAKWHGAQKATYIYDVYWRRVRKQITVWDNTSSTWTISEDLGYVWEGWRQLGEVEIVSADLARTWTWGLGFKGNASSLLWCNETEATQGFAFDGNGNVTATVAASGVERGIQTSNYTYGAFGESIQSSGSYSTINPFRFSTKYHDKENDGQIYFGYRFYNLQTAKWLSRDPLEEGAGLNITGMIDNNPINYIDDSGLLKLPPIIVIPLPGVDTPIVVPIGWPAVNGITSAALLGYILGWGFNQIPGTANLVDELLLGDSGKLDGPQPKPKSEQRSSWFLWDVRIPDEEGYCGAGAAMNHWMVKNMGNVSGYGTLFQNVVVEGQVTPCKNEDGSLMGDSIPKPIDVNDDYSEAWGPMSFPPMATQKMGSDRVGGRQEKRCTKGKVIFSTRAWFTEGVNRPGNWGISPYEPWGGVHGAREGIPFPASSNVVTRTITLEWNCCEGRNRTNITYER